ncbi:MAG: tetratricopeptide repeat protein [bacterium]
MKNIINLFDEGIKLHSEEKFEEAIKKFTKVIEIDPNYAAAYNNRGSAYYNSKKYQKAIEDYTKAIESVIVKVSKRACVYL